MKFKWNWLDTVIVCIVLVLVAAAVVFFLWPRSAQISSSEESFIYVTFDTEKARVGTYDDLKVGDKIILTNNERELGEIVSVEILPSRSAVFNEQSKQYQIFMNEKYPFCRFTVKASGYINDSNEAFASSNAVLYGEEWFMETNSLRVSATITGVEGADNNE